MKNSFYLTDKIELNKVNNTRNSILSHHKTAKDKIRIGCNNFDTSLDKKSAQEGIMLLL